MNAKPLIIYHKDCTDGYGAAFAAWYEFRDNAEYLACQYGDDNHKGNILEIIDGRGVYILDFSFPKEVMEELIERAETVVWLDHHKTAFESWCPGEFDRYEYQTPNTYILLNNNRSGAVLSWEYFFAPEQAPRLLRHIDDRDRWQFKMEGTKEIHAMLSSMKPWAFEQWEKLLDTPVDQLAADGAAILRAQNLHVSSMTKQAMKCAIVNPRDTYGMFPAEGLAVNATLHISEVGNELAKKSGTYGLVWYVGQDGRCKCSLRSIGDYDVSAIAKTFGGGGHKNAAGFETDITNIMKWVGVME